MRGYFHVSGSAYQLQCEEQTEAKQEHEVSEMFQIENID